MKGYNYEYRVDIRDFTADEIVNIYKYLMKKAMASYVQSLWCEQAIITYSIII